MNNYRHIVAKNVLGVNTNAKPGGPHGASSKQQSSLGNQAAAKHGASASVANSYGAVQLVGHHGASKDAHARDYSHNPSLMNHLGDKPKGKGDSHDAKG